MEKQIAFIEKYVDARFFDREKLMKYLNMHTTVGNEIFAYVDKKNCLKKNRKEGYCQWLDDEEGYEPLDIETFIRRIPFFFFVWDGSLDCKCGDLGELLYATYEDRIKGKFTLEDLYKVLEYLFYDQKISLYNIFNYMIDQTGVVTQPYFMNWVDYLHKCEKLGREEKLPECFVTAYNEVLEEIGEEPVIYEIADQGIGNLYMRDGTILTFEGIFPIDEKDKPIMKWIGLKIVNGAEIWNCSCKKSKMGSIKVRLTPDIMIYYLTEYENGEKIWEQLYAGPKNMEFDYTILKEQRKKHHMTQQEVADAVGANVRTYQKWENGETQPDGYYLLRLINWLDIPEVQYAVKYNVPPEI